MKNKRQDAILELIATNEISTQHELTDYLIRLGYNATQATISRDIRDLNLNKISCENGRYKYTIPIHNEIEIPAKYFTLLKDTIINIDYAVNIVSLKTYNGMANAACTAIDDIDFVDIVGTIAGDDTIFVLLRSEESATDFVSKIKSIISKQ